MNRTQMSFFWIERKDIGAPHVIASGWVFLTGPRKRHITLAGVFSGRKDMNSMTDCFKSRQRCSACIFLLCLQVVGPQRRHICRWCLCFSEERRTCAELHVVLREVKKVLHMTSSWLGLDSLAATAHRCNVLVFF